MPCPPQVDSYGFSGGIPLFAPLADCAVLQMCKLVISCILSSFMIRSKPSEPPQCFLLWLCSSMQVASKSVRKRSSPAFPGKLPATTTARSDIIGFTCPQHRASGRSRRFEAFNDSKVRCSFSLNPQTSQHSTSTIGYWSPVPFFPGLELTGGQSLSPAFANPTKTGIPSRDPPPVLVTTICSKYALVLNQWPDLYPSCWYWLDTRCNYLSLSGFLCDLRVPLI